MLRFENILVTGGSGRFGPFVVDALRPDHEVRVLDLNPPPRDVETVLGSTEDRDAVARAMKGVDAVVHLAALDAGVKAPDHEFMRVNVQGLWNVLEAAEAEGVKRVVVASSYNATGFSRDHPPQYLPVDIHHPAKPVRAYGISKLVGETIAEAFTRRSPMSVICLRASLILRDAAVYNLAKATAAAEGTPPPPPASDPTWEPRTALVDSRSFVTSKDAARCFRAALEADIAGFDVFNLMAPDTYSDLPTLEVLKRVFGATPEIRDATTFTPQSRATIYDVRRTRDVLGWEAREKWADVLSRVVASAKGGEA